MKKIFFLFIICTNILIFLNVYGIYQEKEVSDSYNLFGYKDGKYYETIIFHNSLKDVDPNQFIQELNSLVGNYDVMIYTSEESYEEKYQNYYIGYNGSIKNAFGLLTSRDLIFNENQQLFYSNHELKDCTKFFSLNSKFKLNIFPLNELLNIPNGYISQYTIVAKNNDILENIKEVLVNKYEIHFKEFIKYENDTLNVKQTLFTKLKFPIVISVVISSLILLIYIEKSSLKIGIMKLHGFSNFCIYIKIFSSIILIILVGIPFTLLTCFFVSVGIINDVSKLFLFDLMRWGFFQGAALIIVLIVYFAVIVISSYSALLKSSKSAKLLLSVNFVVKVICLVVVMPILYSAVMELNVNIKTLIEGNRIISNTDSIQYSKNFIKGYEYDGYDLAKYYGGDFDEYYDVYQEAYEQLNHAGAFYFNDNAIIMDNGESIPLCSINLNYLENFPIKDEGNKVVDFNAYLVDVLLCIPEKYQNLNLEQYISLNENSYDICYISNKQDYLNFSLATTYKVNSNSPCFLVYSNQAKRIDKSPFLGVYFNGDFNNQLTPYFKDKTAVMDLHERVDIVNQNALDESYDNLEIVISILILLLLTSIEYCYLYFKSNSSSLAIKKLHGYSYVRLYMDIFMENAMVFILLFIICIMQKMRVLPIVILMIFDFIILSTYINVYEKRNIKKILKGGEF